MRLINIRHNTRLPWKPILLATAGKKLVWLLVLKIFAKEAAVVKNNSSILNLYHQARFHGHFACSSDSCQCLAILDRYYYYYQIYHNRRHIQKAKPVQDVSHKKKQLQK